MLEEPHWLDEINDAEFDDTERRKADEVLSGYRPPRLSDIGNQFIPIGFLVQAVDTAARKQVRP